MEQVGSSQFVPGSLTSMRRTSTGSLNSHKRTSSSHSHDYASCSSYHNMTAQCRKTPIAGGSWDDNSVGHGSVAARMRRERNRAIRQTQSNRTYMMNPIDTHASITSTLNLINTTSLSPWQPHDKLAWDDDYDITNNYNEQTAAASRRTAGSLCNIHSTERHPWDSRSIPEYPKMRSTDRTHYRHSFTAANHHSSPTSGCASIASSDIDSADLAFFSMTDDSSLFDGDSLFSDSYGVIDTDSGFSSNIFSLLEEGAISCRTPFPNGDWPDSISELDFDCSEQQNDLSNCDAHSDIGPSFSAPTDRNRLKKRQIRSQTDHDTSNDTEIVNSESDVISDVTEVLRRHAEAADMPATAELPCDNHNVSMTRGDIDVTGIQECVAVEPEVNVDVFSQPIYTNMLLRPNSAAYPSASFSITQTDFKVGPSETTTVAKTDAAMDCMSLADIQHLQVDLSEDFDNRTIVNCDVNEPDTEPVGLTVANLSNWNNMPKDQKLGFVEQLSERISKTMGLQEQLDIIQIIGANETSNIPFRMSIDDIDSHKLSRVLGYLDTHKTVDSPTKPITSSPSKVESNLRRSNSDGNIAKTVSEAQKEQRRRQRQARRFAKWLKQRQRKENRQHMKEQRSGLFVNEKKLKIQAESEEDVEVEI